MSPCRIERRSAGAAPLYAVGTNFSSELSPQRPTSRSCSVRTFSDRGMPFLDPLESRQFILPCLVLETPAGRSSCTDSSNSSSAVQKSGVGWRNPPSPSSRPSRYGLNPFVEALHRGLGLLVLVEQQDADAERDEAFREQLLCKAAKTLNEAKQLRP